MKKRGSNILGKILLVVLIYILVNITFLYIVAPEIFSINNLTGFSIQNTIIDYFSNWSFKQRILFLAQLPLLTFIIIVLYINYFKHKKELNEIMKEDIKESSLTDGVHQTDLDILYNLLKKKKKIHLSSISTAFNINKNLAMEWCKTLESSNMGSIEYPAIGEPYIKIILTNNGR